MNRLLKDKQIVLFWGAFIICGLLLVWKAPYGYIFNDEPFMVTLGHRLVKGDRLFINEWNATQLTGVFFAPFVFLYKQATSSTEGLILFFRYVYVVWWLFVGIILYWRLKQYGWISILAVGMFWLYTPLDEMSLTYNAMGLSLMLLFVSYFLTKGNIILDYVNGIILAFAILAYPGLMLVYLIYFIAVLIKNMFKINVSEKISQMLSWKVFIRATIGATLIAFFICLFIFSAGFSNFFESLSSMFSIGPGNKKEILKLITKLFDNFPIQIICGPLCIIISLIDKNRKKRAHLYLMIQTIVFSVSIILLIIKNTYSFNAIMIPLFICGLQSFILLTKKDIILLVSFGLVGIIYAICAYFSSDTYIPAISNGFVITNIASLIFVYQLCIELSLRLDKVFLQKLIAICLVCVIGIQIGGEFYLKVRRSYWDELFPALRTSITVGAAKNIKTNYYAGNYFMVYEDVQTIKKLTDNNQNQKFLSLSLFPSIYLDMDYEYGTYSSWTYTNNALDFNWMNQKLTRYYELNPNKIADIVYISNEDVKEIDKITCIDFDQYRETILQTGKVYIKV